MSRRELQWIKGFYFGLENVVTAHFLIKVLEDLFLESIESSGCSYVQGRPRRDLSNIQNIGAARN
jgi:hypothetical protein